MGMKNENEKMQEVLANFTSEELLREVHNRNNIYISGWWNSDHILDNTGLPKKYHKAFIEYCNKSAIMEDLEKAVEQWLESIKEELHTILMQWVDSTVKGEYSNTFYDYLKIEYTNDEEGFKPIIRTTVDGWEDAKFEQEPQWSQQRKVDNFFCGLDMLFLSPVRFKYPKMGIKTYLEMKMQELINDYLV